MSRFDISRTSLSGLQIVERRPISDERGFLERLFCDEGLRSTGWPGQVAQVNRTLTRFAGTVRGMHFQYPPYAEWKLVMCIRGRIWDVAADVRRDSATYLSWYATELSESNRRGLMIPPGFAHGFQSLEGNCELIYFHSMPFSPAHEGALNALDPRLAISWPLDVKSRSLRDQQHPFISTGFKGVCV